MNIHPDIINAIAGERHRASVLAGDRHRLLATRKSSRSPRTDRRWAFAVLAVANFITVVDLTIVNVALPTMGQTLGMSDSALQWIVTAYAVSFGGLMLLGGRVADVIGRRVVLGGGLTAFAVASIACAIAPTSAFLIGSRAAQGAAAAFVLPAALAIVISLFPEGGGRNKALALWGAIGAAGGTVGLIVGGLLTRYAGWQYIFYLNVPVALAALAGLRRYVPESRHEETRRRFDLFGALTVTGGLLLLVYTISATPDHGWASTRTLVLLTGTLAALGAFVAIESRIEAPLMPLRMFGAGSAAAANAGGFLLRASFFGFIFVGTLYMQQVLGFSAIRTGLAWLAVSVTSIVFARVSQLLVTRGALRAVMVSGMVMIAGGALLASRVPLHGRYWTDLAVPFFITGIGTAFAFIPISIAALIGVREHEAGVASGLLNTSQQLGGAVGIAIAASVSSSNSAALLAAGSTISAARTGGFQWAFAVCGAIGLAAVPVTVALLRRREAGIEATLELAGPATSHPQAVSPAAQSNAA
jgi:EmrB/QacA subfamily drug resistance transporter